MITTQTLLSLIEIFHQHLSVFTYLSGFLTLNMALKDFSLESAWQRTDSRIQVTMGLFIISVILHAAHRVIYDGGPLIRSLME